MLRLLRWGSGFCVGRPGLLLLQIALLLFTVVPVWRGCPASEDEVHTAIGNN